MRLFIIISLSFLGITRSPGCVYQMTTRTVQSGGSVTIPCSYSDPGKPDEDVRVIWGETDQQLCSSATLEDTIISSSGNVTEKYKGRLYREKDPNRNRTEYITITGLEPMDGPRFCCQLYDNRHENIFKDSRLGTVLQFPEYITQLDEVMAVSGGEVIIPCYYSKDILDITKVTWYYADREHHYCTDTRIQEWSNAHQYGRYSLVNFTQDVSLRIRNIYLTDERSYCCVISTSTARATLKSEQFTRLVVTEYQSSWNQPTNNFKLQEGKSVTLPCSYTLPSDRYTERDVVRVNIYWRVGNVTGPYTYHPYQEMVHSTYRHRTSITEMTNLMINDVMKADNNSFHCFVVVKWCAGKYYYEHEIMYGGGTRLIINDDVAGHTTNDENDSAEGRRTLMIIIVVSSVTIMIILIVILIILKVKGVICKKKTNFSEQQMDSIQAAGVVTSEEAAYCEISTKKPGDVLEAATDETKKTEMENGQMEEGEEGNLLYAKLDQSKLKEKRPAENPMQNEDVVYADVVKTTPK